MWTLHLRDWWPSFLEERSAAVTEFKVSSGDFWIVRGPNGSGKSTLLRQIFHEASLQKIDAFYLPQMSERTFPLAVSLEELLSVYKVSADDSLVRDLKAHRSWSYASGGERSRVMIASAFSQNSNLLILDEPDQSLDRATRDVFAERAREWIRQGSQRALILVSHSEILFPEATILDLGSSHD